MQQQHIWVSKSVKKGLTTQFFCMVHVLGCFHLETILILMKCNVRKLRPEHFNTMQHQWRK